jgi:hypothetical protein
MNVDVWGPHYWFFLHAVARHYPIHPSAIHRKIHYRLMSNFHEFIPDSKSSRLFSELLKENPVTPYLDTRKDLMRWTHHIHNLVNEKLDKDGISFDEYLKEFDGHYSPARFQQRKRKEWHFLIYLVFIALLVLVAVCNK